jgi:protein tyrosine phosphatase
MPSPQTLLLLLISFDHIDNYNRVHLKMSPGIGGSDYINASFIDVSGTVHAAMQVGCLATSND